MSDMPLQCPKCQFAFMGNDVFTMHICPSCRESFAVTNTPRPKAHTFRDPLLVERGKTHGDFGRNADISQQLKQLFNRHGADRFLYVHREALDMIALKLSRILSGQANFKDHWDDIAGYAKLASEACDVKDN